MAKSPLLGTGVSTDKTSSTKSKTNTKTAASQAKIEADASSKDAPTATSSGKLGISGLPLGFEVMTGRTTTRPPDIVGQLPVQGVPVTSKVTYKVTDPYTEPANLNNTERANLLVALGSIPGLYAKGQAPTRDWVNNMAKNNVVTFRPADYTALGKMMAEADKAGGETYQDAIFRFIQNPKLATQTFGKITPTAKTIPVTNPDALISDMTTKYLDLFNSAPDKKTAAAYAAEVNKAQRAAGAKGYSLSAQEQEDIFIKYVEQTAKQRYAKVKATPDTKDDIALEQGSLGIVIRQIRAAHADNGVPTSDKAVYSEALKGIRSEQALQNTLETIKIQAATQFPAWKEDIMKGVSVSKLIAPYSQSYEKIYGKAPDPTDLYDVASGQTAIPVLAWEKAQWKNPKIKETQFYKDTVKNDLRAMANAFGVNV